MTDGEPTIDRVVPARSLPIRMVDGLAISQRPGPGARVVLVHGAMDRAGGFVKVLRRVPDLDVIRYDRRGYGDSRDSGVHDEIEPHVDDLLTVVGDEPAIVVGHSLGGVIALGAAQQRPDLVVSVAAFEAPMPWAPWWPRGRPGRDPADDDPEEAAERFLRRMLGDDLWDRFPASMKRGRRAEGYALMADFRAMADGGVQLDPTELTVPVLAGHGSEARRHHAQAARTLAEDAPQGELMVIDGADHSAHFTHPHEFAAFVRRAVSRAEAP